MCPASIRAKLVHERLLDFCMQLGCEALFGKVWGVVLCGQVPHVCVHRDCAMLVEGEQADAGCHLGTHTYRTSHRHDTSEWLTVKGRVAGWVGTTGQSQGHPKGVVLENSCITSQWLYSMRCKALMHRANPCLPCCTLLCCPLWCVVVSCRWCYAVLHCAAICHAELCRAALCCVSCVVMWCGVHSHLAVSREPHVLQHMACPSSSGAMHAHPLASPAAAAQTPRCTWP